MPIAKSHPSTRDLPVEIAHTALLFIDVQNFCCSRQGSDFKDLSATEVEAQHGYYFHQLETIAVPNMRRLQAGCRA